MSSKILWENFRCKIENDPFYHSTYKFFDEDTCNKLIENIKSIKKLLETSELLSQSRYKINLYGDTKDGFYSKNKFLNELKKLEPLNTIMKEYEKNIPLELYKKYNSDNKNVIKYCLMIVYDKENYEIGPHTDASKRNSTIVSFLGPKSNLKIGTRIYKDKINRHKERWVEKHYSFDDFEEIKQVDYYPGSTVDFKVSPVSFHGVPKINQNCDRYSLQFYIKN